MGREAAAGAAPVPAARREGLVVTEAGEETLVYDTERHHIHRLTPAASAIWRLCDGRRSIDEVASRVASIDLPAVIAVLTELDRCSLLVSPPPRVLLPEGRRSRRWFARRAAMAGAIAVPAIVSVTAPAAAHLSEDSCSKPCSTQKDCKVECLVCKFNLCEPDQCGNPCENDDQCERARAGNCKVCTGPVGVKTCQESHESVVAGAESSAVFESVEAPLDGVDPPPGGTPVVEPHGG